MKQQKSIQLKSDDLIVHFMSHVQDTYADKYTIFPTDDWWYLYATGHALNATQGWKLHLSINPTQAVPLLEVVTPLLMERQIQWKVLLTLEHLARFSSPPSVLPQLGKFITIYPESDEIAVELAALLHEKTCHFSGPVIPSDFRYALESQVYYRYGSFKERYFYSSRTSLRTPCILTPDGTKIPDERTTSPHHPEWTSNPFPTFERKPSNMKGLFGRGFKVRGILSQSIKGGVYVVADDSETFILKEARFGTCPDMLERDMRDRLSNEFHILSRIAHLKIAPQPIDIFDADNNRYLLMEHLPGQTLYKYLEQNNYLGEDDTAFSRHLCESLIELVKQCHTAGVVLRDLSPNNVLITSAGCRLIDLELASLVPTSERPFTGYTRGYVPQGAELDSRDAYTYDIYALGAIFCFILTGVTPYLNKYTDILPRMVDLLDNSTFLKNPCFSDLAATSLYLLTTRELEPKDSDSPKGKTPEMGILPKEALTKASPTWNSYDEDQVPAGIISHKQDFSNPEFALPLAREEIVQQATAIAEYLYEQADWEQKEQLWPFISPRGTLFHPASFYGGASGIATYMCEVAHVTGNPTYYHYARHIMDWVLERYPFVPDETPLGLYFGYAGVPWMLSRLAQGLEESSYLEQADTIAQQLALVSPSRLDLTHGAAGIGLMHLQLFRQTGKRVFLEHAQHLADTFLEQANFDAQEGVSWQEEQLSMWGLAHGTAGIAYFLLALYSQTHDEALKKMVMRANTTLLQASVHTAHGQGLSWRKDTTDKAVPWTHWCHGASGVGTYLLAAAQVLQDAELEAVALKAAQAIRLSTGMASFCQCHGLSGDGEYLLQVSRAFQASEITQAVYQTARKLYTFRLTVEGIPAFVWNNEAMEPDPDYMTGYCGIYGFLLRLCDETLPRPLSFDMF